MWKNGVIAFRTVFDSNDIVTCDNYAEVIIYNKSGNERCRAKISLDKVDIVKEYKWHLSGGYINTIIKSNRKAVGIHRLITGAIKGDIVDHINHDTLDNRNENLRICSYQQNQFNKSIGNRNTSGTIGVSYRKDKGKWRAYIIINNKQISLGNFENIEDAIAARKKAEVEYYGEFRYQEVSDGY